MSKKWKARVEWSIVILFLLASLGFIAWLREDSRVDTVERHFDRLHEEAHRADEEKRK